MNLRRPYARLIVLTIAAALTGCDDLTGPCDDPGAVVTFSSELPAVESPGDTLTLAVTARRLEPKRRLEVRR